MEVKCPHCNKMNAYGLTVKDRYERFVCAVCQKTFFVSLEGIPAKDKDGISKIMAEEKAHRKLCLMSVVAFFPAFIFTGLFVLTLGLYREHHSVFSCLKLTDIGMAQAVIAITGLFFFIWRLSFINVERIWPSPHQIEDR